MKYINHRLLFLIIPLMALSIFMSAGAAPDVASLELTTYALTDCETNTVHGFYRLIARDSNGDVVNTTTQINATSVFMADNGFTYNPGKHDYSADSQYLFDIYLGAAPFTKATLYVYLTANPAIRTAVYTLDCTNNTMYIASGIIGVTGGDDRINPNTGDLINVLYARTDASGNPEIHVYALDGSSKGIFIGAFPYNDFRFYVKTPPKQNLFLRKIGESSLYALANGEFQINIGPDAENKTYTVIFTGMPPTNIYFR